MNPFSNASQTQTVPDNLPHDLEDNRGDADFLRTLFQNRGLSHRGEGTQVPLVEAVSIAEKDISVLLVF